MSKNAPYAPSSLPEVSSVEVVALQGVSEKHVGQYMDAADDAPCLRLTGNAAKRLAEVWRLLPPGNQARCHLPRIGIRFLSDVKVVCQASICWECHNIFGDVKGSHFCYEFDADAKPSQTLLAEIRELIAAFDTTEE